MSLIRRSRLSSLCVAIAVLGGGTAAAGCGATGAPSGTSAASETNSGFQFSRCMRANGVPNFPDPGPNGYRTGPGSGIDFQSPAFESAMRACTKYRPQSGRPPATPASVRREELKLANCMRAHGVTDFPDPDANGDIQFPIGSPIPRSPSFARAQKVCQRYLGGG